MLLVSKRGLNYISLKKKLYLQSIFMVCKFYIFTLKKVNIYKTHIKELFFLNVV